MSDSFKACLRIIEERVLSSLKTSKVKKDKFLRLYNDDANK